MRPVAILRPEPGNALSMTRAREMGIDPLLSIPLFKVRPLDWTPPDPDRFDAILLTSANAARHGGAGMKALRDLPAHAVGDSTAAAAHAAGLMIGEVGDAGIDALLDELPEGARLLHLCGRHRRVPLEAKQTIVPVPVYASVAREDPRDLDRLPGSVACVHSRRAAARLEELVKREGFDGASIMVAAISDQAADAVGGAFGRVEVAAAPRDHDLLSLAQRLARS